MPRNRQLLQHLEQLNGDNANGTVEPPAQQVPRTRVREEFLDEELEWAENAPDRCDPATATWQLWKVCAALLAMMLIHLLLCLPCTDDSALMASSGHACINEVHIDSETSRCFISDAVLFVSWNEDVLNVTFTTMAGAPIYPRVVGNLEIPPFDRHGDQRVVELEQAYHVPNQPHNFLSVSQLLKQQATTWKTPDFTNCKWKDGHGAVFQYSYEKLDFLWKLSHFPNTGVNAVNGVVADCVMVVTGGSGNLSPPAVQHPTGHRPRGQRRHAIAPQDPRVHTASSKAAKFHAEHGIPAGGLHSRRSQPR
eukprot:CAMPEP_0114224864 /NCGR_PEP_ID=MMETSP0058-20121206/340_1 /TAXON_ID=36894 /ORGANISM="Pyramimonas parkeae, CCMP726" /LENGTH=307 /DNA_ID=CAMNT_0001335379 /DNA_START=273 /DNA_END=1192 /DNA_ORIENTATION=+